MSSANSLPYGVNDTAVRTTLSAGITSSDTSVDVGEVTNPPTTPFLIAVFVDQSPLREDDMEIMEVTGVSGTTLTVNRGAKGTTAQSFSGGDKVFMGVIPSDAFDELGYTKEEVEDIVAGLIQGSGSTTVTYDDAANTLKIGSERTNEELASILAAFLAGGTNLTFDTSTVNTLYAKLNLNSHGDAMHTKNYTVAQNGGENIYVQSSQPLSPSDKDIWVKT